MNKPYRIGIMSIKELLLSCLITLILALVLFQFKFPQPFYFLTNDFVIEAFQATKKPEPRNDNIFLVNISDLNVDAIKSQIEILSFYEPAVIGVDYLPMEIPKSSDKIKFNRIVLPLIVDSSQIVAAQNHFSQTGYYGFVNISSYVKFQATMTVKGSLYNSFPTQIVELYNGTVDKNRITDTPKSLIINYSGNVNSFNYLGDLSKISPTFLEEIKDKIVLVGYLGIESPFPTTESVDVHETPQGRMFGVVLWANIIDTLLGNQILELDLFYCALIYLILIVTNAVGVAILMSIKHGYLVIKAFQLVQVAITFVVCSTILHLYHTFIDYEVSILIVIFLPECLFWLLRFKIVTSNPSVCRYKAQSRTG